MTTIKIKVADIDTVNNWQSIEDVLVDYTEGEVLEILGRYMDAQRHAINYRQSDKGRDTAKRAYLVQKEKTSLMKARLAELEAMVKEVGQ